MQPLAGCLTHHFLRPVSGRPIVCHDGKDTNFIAYLQANRNIFYNGGNATQCLLPTAARHPILQANAADAATAAAQWHRASHTHKKRHGRKRPPQQDRAGNGPSTDKLPCKTQQPWPAHPANATELVWQKTTALWQTALGCMAEKAAQWQKTVCKSLDFQSVESGKPH